MPAASSEARSFVAVSAVTSLAVGVVSRGAAAADHQRQGGAQPAGLAVRAVVPIACRQPGRACAWIGYAVPVVDGERMMCCFGGDTNWVDGHVVSDGNGVLPRLPARARGRRHVDGDAARHAAQGSRASSGSKARTAWSCSSASPIARSIASACSPKTASSTPAAGRSHGSKACARPTASRCSSRSRRRPTAGAIATIDGAITAIALHGDAAADAALERLVAPTNPKLCARR